MADNKNEQQNQVQIQLKPEVADGQYANLAMINHSSSEFVIDFAHMLPIAPPQIFSRVIMAPEKEFGEIKLPTAPQEPQGDGRTAMPFGTGNA